MAQRGLKGTQLRQTSSPGATYRAIQRNVSFQASTGTDWDSPTPESLKEAIDRLVAALTEIKLKLDADDGVNDTNYNSTIKP